jgi:hypothetical protein
MAALAAHIDSISANNPYPPLRDLNAGDRVRLTCFPREYLPRHTLHADTRRLYKYLLKRKRPVAVEKIDEWGLPWIRCQLRGRNGRMEHHGLLIGTESEWVKVKRREPRRNNRSFSCATVSERF